MKVVEERMETLADTLNAQNVTHILWSYATMGRTPAEVLIGVLERSMGLALEASSTAHSAQNFDPQDKLAGGGAAVEAVGERQASSVVLKAPSGEASTSRSLAPEDQVIELMRSMLLHLRETEGKEWVDTTNVPNAARMLPVSIIYILYQYYLLCTCYTSKAARMLPVSLCTSHSCSLTHSPLLARALSVSRPDSLAVSRPLPCAVLLAVYILFSPLDMCVCTRACL